VDQEAAAAAASRMPTQQCIHTGEVSALLLLFGSPVLSIFVVHTHSDVLLGSLTSRSSAEHDPKMDICLRTHFWAPFCQPEPVDIHKPEGRTQTVLDRVRPLVVFVPFLAALLCFSIYHIRHSQKRLRASPVLDRAISPTVLMGSDGAV